MAKKREYKAGFGSTIEHLKEIFARLDKLEGSKKAPKEESKKGK